MKLIQGILLFCALLLTSEVYAAKIQNIENASFISGLTQEQAKRAILMAGAGRNWVMTETAAGEINAVLDVRKHQAVVQITFDATNYSITYVDSTNLKARNGNIHRNYNRWVQNLNADIQRYSIQLKD